MADEYNISELVQQMDFSSLCLEECENGILLTKKEKEILDRFQISYQQCGSLKEIIFLIEEIFNEDDSLDLEELDLVSSSLAERDYYQNTNK